MHKIKKKAESRNVCLEMRKERMENPNFMWQPRPSTTARGAQALPPAHQAKTVARRASQGAPAPKAAQPGPSLCRRLHAAMLRLFWVVFVFTCAEPSYIHYLRRGEAHLTTHIIWSPTSLPPLVVSFIVLVVIFWSKESYLESLSPWEKEQLLVWILWRLLPNSSSHIYFLAMHMN